MQKLVMILDSYILECPQFLDTLDKRSKNRTMLAMAASLIEYLGSQPIMQVIKGLLYSSKPRHIRDLASQYSLSPAGVCDIVRRLKSTGVIKEVRVGNKRCVSLKLKQEELKCMQDFLLIFENSLIEKRAIRFSRGAAQKLEWMDDAFKFYRDVKGLKRDPS